MSGSKGTREARSAKEMAYQLTVCGAHETNTMPEYNWGAEGWPRTHNTSMEHCEQGLSHYSENAQATTNQTPIVAHGNRE